MAEKFKAVKRWLDVVTIVLVEQAAVWRDVASGADRKRRMTRRHLLVSSC